MRQESFDVCVHWRDQVVRLTTYPDVPLWGIFQSCKDSLGVDSPASALSFWYISPCAIDGTTLRELGITALQSLYLFPKTDADVLQSFTSTILPSLVYETSQLSTVAKELVGSVHSHYNFARHHSHDEVQSLCLSHFPFDRLDELEGEAKIVEFTRWFKEDFFTFFPFHVRCRLCHGQTRPISVSQEFTQYEADGNPSQVEHYRCQLCYATTRFVRYNAVPRLLETRTGRCGEWVNAFCAMLRLLEVDGRRLDVRTVIDSTDHVWVEFWSEERNRYVHIDPCENLIDKPYVYEDGWGKKFEWIYAISLNQCVDVTRKYTKKWPEVLARRSARVSEDWWQQFLTFKNESFMATMEDDDRALIETRQALDASAVEDLEVREPEVEEQRPRISGQ
jgi:peptide-N4-(N-acetyl-beta-glucosaminyl)asparagine amidase